MKARLIGFIILVAVAVFGVLSFNLGIFDGDAIVIHGYVGGEKIGFFRDEEVQALLEKKFNLIVDDTKAGSYEMMEYDFSDQDFLFPSSQVALEIFKKNHSDKLLKADRVFQSPIVIYSWSEVAEALVKEDLATHQRDEYYTVDINKLIDYIKPPSKEWSDIGLRLYGSIKVMCTDPNKSNSGNMYSGLLYQMISASGQSRPQTIQTVSDILANLGFMESSSGTLFESYLIKGMGANPMIIGYENQIVEFALENEDIWQNAKDNVAILVPQPTVWSEHPVIALTENGQTLIEALNDPEIRTLAWQKHGFRYPAFSNKDDTIVALPETLDQIVDMPSVDIMIDLMDKLKNN